MKRAQIEVDQSYKASSEEGALTLFSKNFNASQCLKVKFLFVQWSKFGGLVLFFLLFLLRSSQYPSVMYVKILVAYLLQTSDRFVVLCGISAQSYWFVLPSVCYYWQTGLGFIQVITYWVRIISANIFHLTCKILVIWKSSLHYFLRN